MNNNQNINNFNQINNNQTINNQQPTEINKSNNSTNNKPKFHTSVQILLHVYRYSHTHMLLILYGICLYHLMKEIIVLSVLLLCFLSA